MQALLEEQLTLTTRLHQLLMDESRALRVRDGERIKALSEKKLQLTARLEQLATEQTQQLSTLALSPTPAGLSHYAKQLPDTEARTFNKILEALTEILAKAKQQNLVNGQMIAATRQSVDVALSILRGQTGPRELTYGPDGETLSSTASNPLASA